MRIPFLMAVLATLPSESRAAPRPEPPPYDPGTTAIVNVNVVTLESPGVLRDRTVIVRQGRIAAIAEAASARVPPDARRVEGRGRYLLPGLADMHVHVEREEDLARYLAHGVTTVRNMAGRPWHVGLRRGIVSGKILGPSLYTAGPLIDGDPPVWPGSEIVRSRGEAEAVVSQHGRAGYDFIKVYSLLSPDAYRAIVEAARRQGLPVVGHVPASLGLRRALEMPPASTEHLFEYPEAIELAHAPGRGTWRPRRLFHAIPIDREQMRALCGWLRRAGTWTCPTAVAFRYNAPAIAFAEWRRDSSLRALGEKNRRALIAGLHRGGARLLVGTDTGFANRPAGELVHEELELFVASGVSPYDALCAATRGAAEFLGVDANVGSVTIGKRADLMLVEGNPLEDIRATRRCAGVMVRGRWLPAR